MNARTLSSEVISLAYRYLGITTDISGLLGVINEDGKA